MSTLPVHESILLGLSPAIAATSQDEVAQAIVALQKGEPPRSPLVAHQDALLRMAWLVFVRAPSLNMSALATMPARFELLTTSGDTLDGILDYARMLEEEAGAPDSELKGLELLKAPGAWGAEIVNATGAALKALVEEALSTLQRSGQHDQIASEVTHHVMSGVAQVTARRKSDRWLDEGMSHHDDQDLEGALEAFNAAVEADPTHVAALLCRAATLDMMGHAQGANDDYQAALELGPSVRAYANYGDFLLRHEKLDAAFGLFTKALSMNPDDLSSLHNRGMILRLVDRLEEARADYQRASEVAPEQVNTWLNLGHVAVEAAFPEAESHFDRALALEPELPEALFGRARAREQKGDTAGAAADRALAAPGQQHEADRLHDLVRWRMIAGNLEGALSDHDRLLALNPQDVQALINQGMILQQMGDSARALAMWDRAVTIAPEHPDAHMRRGMGHLLAGNTAAGAADLQEALRLAPADWPMRGEVESVVQGLPPA